MATEQQYERNEQMLVERVGGATLEQIAEQHDVSLQRVHAITRREATRMIDDLELRLLANRKTGDVELYLIPDHGGQDFDLALEYFRWSLRELAKRGVSTLVHYRPVENGVVFGIEDNTVYGTAKP